MRGHPPNPKKSRARLCALSEAPSMPPISSWDFPLSRAEKTKLLLDLYSIEVRSSQLEISKLRQDRNPSPPVQGCGHRSGSELLGSGEVRAGALLGEISPSVLSSAGSAGHEAPPQRRDVEPRWAWEQKLCGSCQGCGTWQFLVATCKDCGAQYCGVTCLRKSLVTHRRGCFGPTRRQSRKQALALCLYRGRANQR
mmetsp:Transcript_21190/g.49316  ORF Transcript_21190/g.49316 Transcript_21190/m.49316 type:complete len:196 (+) Transcript_21190:7-594(+)